MGKAQTRLPESSIMKPLLALSLLTYYSIKDFLEHMVISHKTFFFAFFGLPLL